MKTSPQLNDSFLSVVNFTGYHLKHDRRTGQLIRKTSGNRARPTYGYSVVAQMQEHGTVSSVMKNFFFRSFLLYGTAFNTMCMYATPCSLYQQEQGGRQLWSLSCRLDIWAQDNVFCQVEFSKKFSSTCVTTLYSTHMYRTSHFLDIQDQSGKRMRKVYCSKQPLSPAAFKLEPGSFSL